MGEIKEGDNQNSSFTCAVCQTPCKSSCGNCKKVSYCGKPHQKDDWKVHKKDCFPLTIQSDPILGRHITATRDLKQGEIIIRERPLLSGPNGLMGVWPVCLACYRAVTTSFSCPNCKWPVCDSECSQDLTHSALECKIFCENQVQPFTAEESHRYEAVTILRGLLLKKFDPEKYAIIETLESHVKNRIDNVAAKWPTESAIKFVMEECKQSQFAAGEITHLIGVLATNAFTSDDPIFNMTAYRNGTYLMHIGSMAAHDCCANTGWTILQNGVYTLRALVPISCDQSVKIAYTEPTLGTIQRRKKLLETKYFSCACARCSDPTELNTYFSAVKCELHDDHKGNYLPVDPLLHSSAWKCDSCEDIKTIQWIEKKVNEISEKIDKLSESDDNLSGLDKLESLLREKSGSSVHENHYEMLRLENEILQRISYILSRDMSKGEMKSLNGKLAERMISLSEKCLQIADLIWPGFNRFRGRLLYFLQQGLTISLLIKTSNKKSRHKETLLQDFQKLLLTRKQVVMILSTEPEGREEYTIAKAMAFDSPEIIVLKKYFNVSL